MQPTDKNYVHIYVNIIMQYDVTVEKSIINLRT